MANANPTAPAVRYQEVKPGYRVGDDGSVWSCVYPAGPGKTSFRNWKLLKPTPQYRGHLAVWLGRKDQRFVHRLVLESFVGPCPEGMECRHLNGNPGDNRLENLTWGTPSQNYADSRKHGTAFFRKGMSALNPSGRPVGSGKLTPQEIAEIRATPLDSPSIVWTRLAIRFNMSHAYIKMIAMGLRCQKV